MSKTIHDIYLDDITHIMEALGLSTHARTESAHELVGKEIVPAIRALRAELVLRRPPNESSVSPHVEELVSALERNESGIIGRVRRALGLDQ